MGTFPPYNRHYEGDTGAFVLALGAVLLVAAPRVARYRAVVLAAAAGTLAHAANHAYDAVGEGLGHWIGDVGPHGVLAALLLWAATR